MVVVVHDCSGPWLWWSKIVVMVHGGPSCWSIVVVSMVVVHGGGGPWWRWSMVVVLVHGVVPW